MAESPPHRAAQHRPRMEARSRGAGGMALKGISESLPDLGVPDAVLDQVLLEPFEERTPGNLDAAGALGVGAALRRGLPVAVPAAIGGEDRHAQKHLCVERLVREEIDEVFLEAAHPLDRLSTDEDAAGARRRRSAAQDEGKK